ncbi:hypothetical protein, partial [Aeromonas caviae]|uniref:hypothetical protein n=1 Tax=Aeromonas caviae TaxID=648 RepID=UPI001CC7F5BA
VLNQLIEIGIEEAMKALPPDVAADIRGHAGQVIMDDLSGMTTNIGSNIRWKGLHSLFDAYLDELVKNLVTA